MLSIDKLDVQLLGLLGKDSRMSVAELANSLGVARNTVQSRMKRMETSGLLTGFRPNLDLAQVGIPIQAFVGLELEQGKLTAVGNRLVDLPEVIEIHATTGREDLLVRVATSTHAELQKLLEKIANLPGITHSTTTIALTSPLPYRIQPLLEHLTGESGWGRSTALPRSQR
ncbi:MULTISPECIES: Lrp/AsnC family transcriptional regulator [Rhodococcus]|uniref:AsnC family transcriptional regulator n=1 Tax=Rhodococcus oxybenzonivorans TaxID=1990687 RepID=A0A2S2BTG6_9NOCA|nr:MULTISPECIES: Lrp/AsnC family transcriptional regulator [Rhodococcus]AWK71873.1 AsnC family transcriptional regulator [Rhodococcus oxybenzonivorans]MDV7245831.1 Lrp/AsnC family transcriptional regulator [Rhodococcus oxybenzonivorans]MDV7264853.1 Lrp/AsnC family transcriptional regulator [Rhodococcus oxybenzonivorans]MDV7277365.1 Lrp/AsnC family transcriptional regulator [Rhodococcus oxybenzonivorans]MDV7336935.1 Lrp/AsnC family transcriptional regulator [Rhodococcus oxybenzonivorans]